MAKPAKKIGLISATSLVMGNMIGSGIFLLPAALAAYGSISLLAWILSGAGAIFLAIVFARLAVKNPKSGGPYAYSREGFGDFAGFLAGWGYWISTWSAVASIAVTFIGYLAVFVPPVSSSNGIAATFAILSVWVFTVINLKGVKTGATVQVATTILKLVPLILISSIGLFFIESENYQPIVIGETSALSAVTASAALTLFAFLGVECATIPAQYVKNPKKNIPRATLIGTIGVLVVYLFSTLVIFGISGPEFLMNSEAPFSDAAGLILDDFGIYLVAFGAVASTAGAINGWILIQGQIPFAISKDRLFPPSYSKINKSGAPYFGLIVGSVLASILILSSFTKGLVNMYSFMILLSTLTVLVSYLFSSLAESATIIKEKGSVSFSDIKKPLLIGVPAFVYSVWMVYGAGMEVVFYGFIMLILGIPFYVWTKFKTKVKTQDQWNEK